MGKVRLVQRMCAAAAKPGDDSGQLSEWCAEEFLWIGLADYEDFHNPHWLATKNIKFHESDDEVDWSYYVQSLDETEWHWHPIGWVSPVTANPRS